MIKPFPPQEELLPCAPPEDFLDRSFQTRDGFELGIRIWPHPMAEAKSPWILWCHGGAFCAGSHHAPPSWVIPTFRARGFHVVSPAYRLAPAVNMKTILMDVSDGFQWCRRNLARCLSVDIERYAIGGDSAGGFLAQYLAFDLRPQPKVVINAYGPSDFTIPPPQFNGPEESWEDRWKHAFSAEANDAYLYEGKPCPVSTMAPFIWEIRNISEEETRRRWRLPSLSYDAVRFQTQLGDYMGYKGAMRQAVFGMSGHETPEDRVSIMKGWSPRWRLTDVVKYPAAAFLHGDDDHIVPIEHSRRMAAAAKEKGSAVWESFVPEMPHAFDQVFTDPSVDGWQEWIDPLANFAARHCMADQL